MKAKHILLLALITIITSSHKTIDKINTGHVNPIIGDISYVEEYGNMPSDNTNENIRIKTHLKYVEDLHDSLQENARI